MVPAGSDLSFEELIQALHWKLDCDFVNDEIDKVVGMNTLTRGLHLDKIDTLLRLVTRPISALRQIRNTRHPINRLPVELLCKVFRSMQESMIDIHYTFPPNDLNDKGTSEWIPILTSVCRHWRNAALCDPFLWQYYRMRGLKANGKGITQFLERSSPLPMHLYHNDIAAKRRRELVPLLHFLQQHPHRVGSIHITDAEKSTAASPQPIHTLLSTTILPNLSNLHIHGPGVSSIIADHVPALTHLSVGWFEGPLPPSISHLTHLCLDDSSWMRRSRVGVKYEVFLKMLQHERRLRKLILKDLKLTDIDANATASRAINMPELVDICVLYAYYQQRPGKYPLRLFHDLVLPKKTNFIWSVNVTTEVKVYHPYACPPSIYMNNVDTLVLIVHDRLLDNSRHGPTFNLHKNILIVQYSNGHRKDSFVASSIPLPNVVTYIDEFPSWHQTTDKTDFSILGNFSGLKHMEFTDYSVNSAVFSRVLQEENFLPNLSDITLWIRPLCNKDDEPFGHVVKRWSGVKGIDRETLKNISKVARSCVNMSFMKARSSGRKTVWLHLCVGKGWKDREDASRRL